MILVTGGAGYIGSICVTELLTQGYEVIVVDDLSEGNREAVLSDAVFNEGDYGDMCLLERIFKKYSINAVIHFAASASVPLSMKNPGVFYRNNVVNGINLLEIMRRFNCKKMIFSSSAGIYGEPVYVPIDEKHPLNPINPYGETKLAFEKILYWYHKIYGFQVNSFRYFNASGATEKLGEAHKHESHLIPLIIKVAMGKKEKLEVYGNNYDTKDGTCVRDFVHVIDIAKAHILALNNIKEHPYAAYNLGCGVGYSVKEVIIKFKEISGLDVPFRHAGRRRGDPAVLVASHTKAKREIGWIPTHSLKKIIESAWKWHKQHQNGY